MERQELLQSVQEAVKAFAVQNPSDAGIGLFETLGYPTHRRQPLQTKTAAHFLEIFSPGESGFSAEKALCERWEYVDLLFQITGNDLSDSLDLFSTDQVDETIIEAYLFFVIKLEKGSYSRTALSTITRQINRLFPMPVMVLFAVDTTITLSVVDRRVHRRDASRDILQKVTLIKDIASTTPHRAHLEILADLSFPELQRHNHPIHTFVELHRAWQATLDIAELNKQFYREISDWYFWAQSRVRFPSQNEIPPESRTQINLIRLLARIIFVWFMRERTLIPEELFRRRDVETLVDLRGSSSYYKAILQNLFFATLNREMDSGERRFRTEEGKPNQDYLNFSRYRYKKLFRDPDRALELFRSIPFLNGGLFECLDGRITEQDGSHTEIRIDGFSDRPDNELDVPNELFFGDEQVVDLSGVLDDTSFRREKVRGLISILERYKFTITENTPVEEEIALDPELLGRVFENLLASFNPETQETARKQTGSFYTPREIVDYMTDEALTAYLVDHAATAPDSHQLGQDLRAILSYREEEPQIPEKTAEELVDAIEHLRIMDPACGSGAFPMGVLNKLVLLLQHLDPHNERWKEKQLSKVEQIDDPDAQDKARREIVSSFEYNELDYGRKLFLVKNAIYGVDIQPIAIHIAKLRFFISLLVDQRIDPARPNLGVQALPNLESNFVAADTLRTPHLEAQQEEMRFEDEQVEQLEKELRSIRERHFLARDRHAKEGLRKQDEIIREKLRMYMQDTYHYSANELKKVVEWNPYDQNTTAEWFDPALMFGLQNANRFDIVIGNPPYRRIQRLPDEQKSAYAEENFRSYAGSGDIYLLFYERGLSLLKQGGYLSYITSNKWMRAAYGESFRRLLTGQAVHELLDFGDHQFFDNATTYVNIALIQRGKPTNTHTPRVNDLSRSYDQGKTLRENLEAEVDYEPMFAPTSYVIARPAERRLKEKIEAAGKPLGQWDVRINRGILTGLNEAFVIDGARRAELIAADPRSEEIIVPLVRGKDLKRYRVDWKDLWLINAHNGVKKQGIPRINVPKKYPAIYEHLKQFRPAIENRQDQGDHWTNLRNCAYLADLRHPKIVYSEVVYDSAFVYDEKGYYPEATSFYLIGEDERYLTAVLNSRISTFAFTKFYMGGDLRGQTFRYKKEFLTRLPVPTVTSAALANHLGGIVDRIQEAVVDNQDTSHMERNIDAIVCVLYGLSYDDITVIDGHAGLSEDDIAQSRSLLEQLT
jgi:adenine-specific DNA-methyltransferase